MSRLTCIVVITLLEGIYNEIEKLGRQLLWKRDPNAGGTAAYRIANHSALCPLGQYSTFRGCGKFRYF